LSTISMVRIESVSATSTTLSVGSGRIHVRTVIET